MARKRYREWALEQPYLLPPSLQDWLEPDHRVYRILEVVDELDISEIEDEVESSDPRGARPYHPRMMLALLIYGYSEGLYSSRKIARAAQERVPFRVLAANNAPHFTVINRFRDRHRRVVPALFAQVALLCRRLGLATLFHVSVDGTKMQANASKHRAMSYARMDKELAELEGEIERLLAKAEAEDAREDEQYGAGRDRDELPTELKRREDRVKRIREGKAALEAEAKRVKAAQLRERAAALRERAESETDPIEEKRKRTRARCSDERAQELDPQGGEEKEEAPTHLPSHRVGTTKEAKPSANAQHNFTDADSRIMCRDGAFVQGYNAQIAVDSSHQIIVAVGVSNQAPDQEYLAPMIERVGALECGLPTIVTADAGYISTENVDWCADRHIDAYISTSRQSHRRGVSAPPVSPKWQPMANKLATDNGRRIYARRKAITEPVFGQIREARGFRRFSMRGRAKVEAEWTFVALVHNILKIVSLANRSSTLATQPA